MAGPGGGSRGGGGRRGGFRGGSRGFGGFGGFHGGSRYRRYGRRYYRGPRYGLLGSFSGLLAMLTPLFFLGMVLFFDTVSESYSALLNGGGVFYDEETFQAYADEQYAIEFADAPAEDNLLIIVLTEPECFDYYYIAWVGDHVDSDVAELFGDERTIFGEVMYSAMDDDTYEQNLDSKLVRMLSRMEYEVVEVTDDGALTCDDPRSTVCHVTNHTDLPLTERTVNNTLESFTYETGISTVVVVEDMEDVFGKTFPPKVILTLVITAALAVGVVVLTVYLVRKQKDTMDEPEEESEQPESMEDHERLNEDWWRDRY